jgi:predicted amidophosphoribosyltransferase
MKKHEWQILFQDLDEGEIMESGRGSGLGSGGFCICPKCGEKIPHQRGIPCQDVKCPKCSAKMMREGSYHHNLLEEKKQKKSGESN